VLTAALVGPYFVDWTSYRADFEREASAILGRKVTVEGEAKARLLPFPSVSFSNVKVAGADGEQAMTVETFSMDAELAPFLRGEVLIFDMRLVRPRAVIGISHDGTVDWAMRPSSPFDPRQIALETLTITDGEVTVRHAASGRNHFVSDIDAAVSARTLAGPWRVDGSAAIDGVAMSLAVSTGPLEGGKMRLRIRAHPTDYPLAVESDGDVRIEDGGFGYAGMFRLNARTEEQIRRQKSSGATFATTGEAADPPAYRVSGRFELGHELLDIPEFRLETGSPEDPYTAEGAAFIDLGPGPRFSVRADGAQIRFDDGAERPEGEGVTLGERIEAFKRFAAMLPRPEMPGALDVNLPAVVIGDTTIRSVQLSAEPAEGGWRLNALRALLPGRTTLEADGFLGTGEEFGFDGSLLLAVGQPSGFAAWVAKDVDDAIRRLPAAGFAANVELSEHQQRFRELELVLGEAKFEGEIDITSSGEARPSMLLRLAGGELDVDGLTAFASLFVSEHGVSRFADHDLDVQLAAGPVHAVGLTAETVDAALRLKEGQLDVDRLAVSGLAGAAVSATGRISDFPTDPKGELDASLVAVDLRPLITLVAQRYPDNAVAAFLHDRAAAFPGFFEDTSIDVVATAAVDDDATGFAASAHGMAGGTSFNMTATARGDIADLGQASVMFSFNASNEDATALMALYGLPALPLGATGPGETSLALQGTPDGGLGAEFSFEGIDLELAFDGVVRREGEGFAADGAGLVRAEDLEPWLMTAGVSLPGMGLGLPVALETDIAYAEDVLVLSQVRGSFADSPTTADLRLETKGEALHVAGKLALDEFDLGLAAAAVLGETPLQGGEGTWPDTPFDPLSRPAFTADLELSAKSLTASGLADGRDAHMQVQLDEDGLRVADLDARLFGGKVGGLFELQNNEGTGLFSGQLRFVGVDLVEALEGTGPAGTGDFTAALTASGKSVSGMMATLSGSGTASLDGLVIPGVNPDALAPILARADEYGTDLNAAATADFAPEIATDGAFEAGDAEFAFTIAGGVLRVPPLRLEASNAAIAAELRADVSTATFQATGQVAYEAGNEALVGADPAIGFTVEGPVTNPEIRFDVQPLAQFLTQRALEREQQRVEAMQAELLEKQRLRREVRYYASLEHAREKRREAERLQVEQEARRRAQAQQRLRAEEEARRQAEEEARLRAEEEEVRRREEEERTRAEEEARIQAEQDAARAPPQDERSRPPPQVERSPLPPPRESQPHDLPGVRNPFDETGIERLLQSLE
jgi:uncharacterized protein involved in outer membrane biogenesis